ncbi:Bbp37 [Bacteroides fragilis]|uniref:A1S_2505 family phage non-structural protein n=1 Tax=Bacteroides fragilis TaxID=817 RepID=UPI0036D48716
MKQRVTSNHIERLQPNEIFVFGSNLSGHHGGGAALLAMNKWGAIWGQGVGLQGQTYGIPTMQGGVETIRPYVDEFIQFANKHPEMTFLVTEIGCGIAGFTPQEIAPLFAKATTTENIHLPQPKTLNNLF